jgi:hypothetical protein
MNISIDMQHLYENIRIAMMLLEMAAEIETNPVSKSYGDENDYIWAAHSYLQCAGSGEPADLHAKSMYSKIMADAAIENWQYMAKNYPESEGEQ